MELSEFKKAFIFTARFDLPNDNFIELREPTTLEMKNFGDDGTKNTDTLIKLLPECIIDHSFEENGVKADNKKVGKLLQESSSVFIDIINTWMESLPLNKKKSETSKM